jgi:hypothetical protein
MCFRPISIQLDFYSLREKTWSWLLQLGFSTKQIATWLKHLRSWGELWLQLWRLSLRHHTRIAVLVCKHVSLCRILSRERALSLTKQVLWRLTASLSKQVLSLSTSLLSKETPLRIGLLSFLLAKESCVVVACVVLTLILRLLSKEIWLGCAFRLLSSKKPHLWSSVLLSLWLAAPKYRLRIRVWLLGLISKWTLILLLLSWR